MPTQKVWIVGRGAVTPVGFDAAVTAASVRANLSRFRETDLVDSAGDPIVMSLAGFIGPELRDLHRLKVLALPAVHEAVAPLAEVGVAAVPLVCGVHLERRAEDSALAAALMNELVSAVPMLDRNSSRCLAAGHASALLGLEMAAQWIRGGHTDVALVGGVDTYCDADTVEWLDETGRLHSSQHKDGFVPGEGAAFCALMSAEVATRYGLRPLAEIVGCASASEPYPLMSTGTCIGEGLTTTLREALATDATQAKPADWTICDMNGESFRSREWVYAYLRTGKKHRDPLQIWHPADCYGDVGAASGAVLANIAIAAWDREYARGDQALVWTSSDNGYRAAALLRRPSAG
jgi:3-oxoacyl-[acyl-carrier-protein] synthase I